MNTNDLLASWSLLSLDQVEDRLQTGKDAEALEQLFGATEAAELRDVLDEPRTRGPGEAVVLLPGVMGSLLHSIRGITTLLWINPMLFLQGKTGYLELNQEGTGDGSPAVEIVPIGLEKLCYLKISLALRRHAELHEFPYDWRLPIEVNADLLAQCIERWADGNPDRQFHLVGHSMGGLVSRAYLARHTTAAERRVKHLIMHGTPHFGAAGAVENLIMGNRMMDIAAKLNKNNALHHLLLNLPCAYQLVPAPTDLFPSQVAYPADWNLYDSCAWPVEGIRQDYLDAGQKFHHLLASCDPQVQITQIAGCNQDTVVGVRSQIGTTARPTYQFIRKEGGTDGGDGTVPLWSAVLPGATMYYVEEIHRYLPRSKHVIQATLDLIRGQSPSLDTQIPAQRRAARAAPIPPVEVETEHLRLHLEEGSTSEEQLSQLFFAL